MKDLVVGVTYADEPLTLPSAPLPHTLVSGISGAGKSGVVHAVIGALAGLSDVAVLGIDLKQVELSLWRPRLSGLAVSVAEADRILGRVKMLITERSALLAKRRLRTWSSELGPFVVLVIDELAELMSLDQDRLSEAVARGEAGSVLRSARADAQLRVALLASMARTARSSGISLVCATQFPTAEVIDSQLRAQLGIRIMLRVVSEEQIRVCLGQSFPEVTVASIGPGEPGGLWVTGHGDPSSPLRGRSFWVTDENIRDRATKTARYCVSAEELFPPVATANEGVS